MVKLVKFSLVPVVALLLMALWVQGVFAHGSVDQSNEARNRGQEKKEAAGSVVIAFNLPIGQEFKPAQPTLTGVDLYLTSVNPQLGDGEVITVNIRKGTLNSPVLATGFQLVRSFDQKGRPIIGFVHINLQPALTVETEAVYVLEVVAPPDAPAAGTHAMTWSNENKYPGGRAFWADIDPGIPIFFEQRDFWFRTYY